MAELPRFKALVKRDVHGRGVVSGSGIRAEGQVYADAAKVFDSITDLTLEREKSSQALKAEETFSEIQLEAQRQFEAIKESATTSEGITDKTIQTYDEIVK
jgi:hypothetical protein